MKRILLSILIGVVFVVVYMMVVSVISILNEKNVSLLPYLNFPVRLPQVIFYYFSPPTAEDYQMETFTNRKLFLTFASFIINSLLYSILTYFFLAFISRFKKSKPLQTEPPPPPSFK